MPSDVLHDACICHEHIKQITGQVIGQVVGSRIVKWMCTVNIEQSRYIEQECSVYLALCQD